jgi:hypothetical protein
MVALEAGTVAIGATDKDYKIYVSGDGVPKGTIKFYFQHLTVEQRKRFIELVNEKKIVWQSGERGFYVLPFFMCYADGRPSPIR